MNVFITGFKSVNNRATIFLIACCLVFASLTTQAQNIGINSIGQVPDPSSILDLYSTSSGLLIPRMTTGQMNSITAPALGLQIYNTTTNCFMVYTGSGWQSMFCTCTSAPSTPGAITGVTSFCSPTTGNSYSIGAVAGANSYTWYVPAGASITSGQGTNAITVDFGSSSGNISVTANNSCGISAASTLAVTINAPPAITVQPISAAVICSGAGIASFTVSASGSGLTYQWQEFKAGWSNVSGSYYSGGNSATLTVTNPIYAMNGRLYQCIVSGTCSPSATTNGLAALNLDSTGIVATGGTITNVGGRRIHTFTSSGTFTISSIACGGSPTVEVLVVAGGAGGGGGTTDPGNAGGGGAGGYTYNAAYAVGVGSTTVTIGGGGAGATGWATGSPGGNSIFGTITTLGGGGGSAYDGPSAANGGSGGGASQYNSSGGNGAGTGTAGQGNNGGAQVSQPFCAGGGGGASGAGSAASGTGGCAGGPGGAGTANSISGASVYYAGGGAGSTHNSGSTFALGGIGGGGNGHFTTTTAQNGTANTGGGGGGGGESTAGGNGGSGIVIVSYVP